MCTAMYMLTRGEGGDLFLNFQHYWISLKCCIALKISILKSNGRLRMWKWSLFVDFEKVFPHSPSFWRDYFQYSELIYTLGWFDRFLLPRDKNALKIKIVSKNKTKKIEANEFYYSEWIVKSDQQLNKIISIKRFISILLSHFPFFYSNINQSININAFFMRCINPCETISSITFHRSNSISRYWSEIQLENSGKSSRCNQIILILQPINLIYLAIILV